MNARRVVVEVSETEDAARRVTSEPGEDRCRT
jgi:hypothetical protein